MRDLIIGAEFNDLFRTFQRSARRLESRPFYDVSSERAPFHRFLGGVKDDPAYRAGREDWLATVRSAAAAGKRRERVRVVSDPLGDYDRFGVRGCRHNVEAGEHISYLWRHQANELDLPDHDFWLFDSERLALMWFTADHRLLGVQIVTDPDVVARHDAWLDLAVAHATPYRDFLAADPTRDDPPGVAAR